MSIPIKKKIVSCEVVSSSHNLISNLPKVNSDRNKLKHTIDSNKTIAQMHEKMARPDTLSGSTYKIKTPMSEYAFYITINDILLNPGTQDEKPQPFEIFINSKNMEHYQWISGLTLIISSVFRKGGDVNFLVSELKSVFDPKGGYFKRGGKFIPSLVAEIGEVIESHLKKIGMITVKNLDQVHQSLIQQKRKEFVKKRPSFIQERNRKNGEGGGQSYSHSCSNFFENARICLKCHVKSVVSMDGCMICLNCGESKCG